MPLPAMRNPVGASLLAKALAQPALVQADTPLSRAGSLPQDLYPFHPQQGPLRERTA